MRIDYPTHNTIRIRCGTEVVEMPLYPPSPPIQQTVVSTKPAPAPAADAGDTPQSTLPREGGEPPTGTPKPSRGWPKPPPGVMQIVMIEGRSPDRGDGLARHQEPSSIDALSLPISAVQGIAIVDLRRRLQRVHLPGGEVGARPRFLNLEVRPKHRTGSIDVKELQMIVQDSSFGVQGIRLMFMSEDDPS